MIRAARRPTTAPCLSSGITNSPVSGGDGTQYVCTAAAVTGNAFTQVNPTNVTLTLTNDATLTWQWQTEYWLATSTNGNGTVTAADGGTPQAAALRWSPRRPTTGISQRWEGDTNGCASSTTLSPRP